MPLTMDLPAYLHLPLPARREVDAWLEAATGLTTAELCARAVTLLDEGGAIEVERVHHPVRLDGDEIRTYRERFVAPSAPPHFVAA